MIRKECWLDPSAASVLLHRAREKGAPIFIPLFLAPPDLRKLLLLLSPQNAVDFLESFLGPKFRRASDYWEKRSLGCTFSFDKNKSFFGEVSRWFEIWILSTNFDTTLRVYYIHTFKTSFEEIGWVSAAVFIKSLFFVDRKQNIFKAQFFFILIKSFNFLSFKWF